MKYDWETELQTINVNATGFVALANLAFHYFCENGGGHIAGVSSIASIKGHRQVTTYNATKSFISSYMEGLDHRIFRKKLPVTVTDIRPGFVLTEMTEKNRGMFWVASTEKAASQIFNAIIKKKRVVYITKRWVLVAWFLKLLPWGLYKRMM